MGGSSKLLESAQRLVEDCCYDAALCQIREAIVAGPPNARLYLIAAICHAELGSPETARSELEVALALDDAVRREVENDPRLASL